MKHNDIEYHKHEKRNHLVSCILKSSGILNVKDKTLGN